MRDEIMKLKAALYDLQERMKLNEELVDLLIDAIHEDEEELAEHELEDAEEHEALAHLAVGE